ncbi:zinc-binding protein A33-like isoform X2 [Protopterus annectens]|uniref:zinc-binding protein A33-like isoform X2 n=1 Tax=Protopterus annectens TaxID=7888 RepID=UPI001CFA34A2|nr:zinc-binding protein A33-like isoform X2 [Protopterus annectens]
MMACNKQTEDFEEELYCPICLETFKTPVILDCGHNFCEHCITVYWNKANILSCPECRCEFSTRKFTVNRKLARLTELIIKPDPKPEQVCKEHEKIRELFCMEDETLLCTLCVPKHHGHPIITLPEAMGTYQEFLKQASINMECILEGAQEANVKQEQAVTGLNECSQNLEHHITSEFAKLHQFLQDKQQELIEQLKEETAGILRNMEENRNKISNKRDTIHINISTIRLQLESNDALLFLLGVKNVMKSILTYLDPQIEDCITVVKTELNLKLYKDPQLLHNIWKDMGSLFKPVKGPPPEVPKKTTTKASFKGPPSEERKRSATVPSVKGPLPEVQKKSATLPYAPDRPITPSEEGVKSPKSEIPARAITPAEQVVKSPKSEKPVSNDSNLEKFFNWMFGPSPTKDEVNVHREKDTATSQPESTEPVQNKERAHSAGTPIHMDILRNKLIREIKQKQDVKKIQTEIQEDIAKEINANEETGRDAKKPLLV